MSQKEYRTGVIPTTNPTAEHQPMTLTSASIDGPAVRLNPGAREQRWFHAHEAEMIAQYGGRWIAVSGDTVLGAADDARGAYEQAKARGFGNAAVIQVPERAGEWDNLFF
jgi:hypothetical protein